MELVESSTSGNVKLNFTGTHESRSGNWISNDANAQPLDITINSHVWYHLYFGIQTHASDDSERIGYLTIDQYETGTNVADVTLKHTNTSGVIKKRSFLFMGQNMNTLPPNTGDAGVGDINTINAFTGGLGDVKIYDSYVAKATIQQKTYQ